jgi:hypothetical protein
MTRNSSSNVYGMNHNNHYNGHHSNVAQSSKQRWSNVLFYFLFITSLIIFEVLLVNKLDNEMPPTSHLLSPHHYLYAQSSNYNNNNNKFVNPFLPSSFSNSVSSSQSINYSNSGNSSNISSFLDSLSYFLVTLPLYFVYFSLICLSFNNHSGNTLWFGLKIDFCELFLNICSFCQIYGNVQIKLSKKDVLNASHNFFSFDRPNNFSQNAPNNINNANIIQNNLNSTQIEQSRILLLSNNFEQKTVNSSNNQSMITYNNFINLMSPNHGNNNNAANRDLELNPSVINCVVLNQSAKDIADSQTVVNEYNQSNKTSADTSLNTNNNNYRQFSLRSFNFNNINNNSYTDQKQARITLSLDLPD